MSYIPVEYDFELYAALKIKAFSVRIGAPRSAAAAADERFCFALHNLVLQSDVSMRAEKNERVQSAAHMTRWAMAMHHSFAIGSIVVSRQRQDEPPQQTADAKERRRSADARYLLRSLSTISTATSASSNVPFLNLKVSQF